MSVLIKGAKMPRCCEVCPCNDDNWRCGALGDTFDDLKIYDLEHKPSFCPLVEVKEPHGRLIDADAFERRCMFDNEVEDMQDVIYALREYPTAIESEEQEHEL